MCSLYLQMCKLVEPHSVLDIVNRNKPGLGTTTWHFSVMFYQIGYTNPTRLQFFSIDYIQKLELMAQ